MAKEARYRLIGIVSAFIMAGGCNERGMPLLHVDYAFASGDLVQLIGERRFEINQKIAESSDAVMDLNRDLFLSNVNGHDILIVPIAYQESQIVIQFQNRAPSFLFSKRLNVPAEAKAFLVDHKNIDLWPNELFDFSEAAKHPGYMRQYVEAVLSGRYQSAVRPLVGSVTCHILSDLNFDVSVNLVAGDKFTFEQAAEVARRAATQPDPGSMDDDTSDVLNQPDIWFNFSFERHRRWMDLEDLPRNRAKFGCLGFAGTNRVGFFGTETAGGTGWYTNLCGRRRPRGKMSLVAAGEI